MNICSAREDTETTAWELRIFNIIVIDKAQENYMDAIGNLNFSKFPIEREQLFSLQLTSADLGLEKDFLVGVRLEKGDPGEKVWDEKRFSEAKIIKKITQISNYYCTGIA